jgi:hypothetical protein
MEVNFIGPIIATQAFGPLLGSDPALKGPKGRIVMISSVAGKNGNPMTSAYSASKHAIEGLSESLRRELMLFGIDVIIIAPGAVKTPIWSKAEEVDISPYKNSPYLPALEKIRAFMLSLGATGLPAETIAEKVFGALTLPNPKVRYTIVPDPMQQLDGGGVAQAHPRQDHRQAPRADAAGMSMMLRTGNRPGGRPCARIGRPCRRSGRARTILRRQHVPDGGMPQGEDRAWDKRLNIAYQKAVQDAGSAQRDQLRAAQRLWVQYRDANCLYYGMGEGTIARLDAGECMRSMTEARAKELEGLGRQ